MTNNTTDWNKWLETKENDLKTKGYRRFVQNFKQEDFAYWKTFRQDGKKTYMVGLLFYDFRKYKDTGPYADRISIAYECMLIGNCRVDLSVSKEDITLEEFEQISHDFYYAMVPHFPGIHPVDEED